MTKKVKTIVVSDWETLIKSVEFMNPYQNTLILTGFINQVEGDKLSIKSLVFSVKSIDILRDKK